MKKTLLLVFMLVFWAANAAYGMTADDIKVIVQDRNAVLTYQVIDEGKILVSVLDSGENPIKGLTEADFRVGSGIQKAEIVSAAPLETTEEVALNIVFVVDNSFSMKERRAVKPLLTAMDEFFKTVRPIDNIHLVVFDDDPAMKVDQYALHTQAFKSSNVPELQNFLKESLEQRSTGKTYLYEAMTAGINIVRQMPAKDQKFMVVFSDGEDLNSSMSTAIIEERAEGIKNFEAFCVDYMPGAKLNRFLTDFAKNHDGRIWKATSASELLPIFQAFTTTLRYRYVVNYRLLDPVTAEPDELNFEMLTKVDGAPLSPCIFFDTGSSEIPADYILIKDPVEAASFDESALTTAMDRYLNVLNLIGQNLSRDPSARIKIVGCNSDSGVEKSDLDLSARRAASVVSYLQEIWGIEASRMDIETRNLPANATPMEVVGARPENQRVEIVYDSMEMKTAVEDGFIVEASGRRELAVKTSIFVEAGISGWQLKFFGDDQPFKSITGEGDIEPSHMITLQDLELARLTNFDSLAVQARVTDAEGKVFETEKIILPVTVSAEKWDETMVHPPRGSLILEPAAVTIEELTTIDSSPFLNYIYFENGDSEIPSRYNVYSSQSDAREFDESELKGTLEKHHHVLNILGRRLLDQPESRIRIVGCNSNRDVEHSKTDLSRSRAEAVKAYLKYIWGVESGRMDIEARNLPAVASTSSRAEGREENQRVEIYSDSPALLDIVKSTYVQEISDARQFLIKPQIDSAYEIDHWTISLAGDGMPIESLSGQRDIEPAYYLALADVGLSKLSAYRTITAGIEVTDRKGQTIIAQADANVTFVKRKELQAQKEGYRVLEKYALILFDFNSSEIKSHNKEIVDRIVARIKAMPQSNVSIVGHTDTIGNEAYNLDLSTRRARAAYDQILAGGVPEGDNITYKGIGPHDALFDNELPEGRALNRTVTVTLEYEKKE